MAAFESFEAREIFRAMGRHRVDYVTVGGIALQAHGGQRLTRDLDIVIPSSRENTVRLAEALQDLDARILGPGGQRSQGVPGAALLDSSDQWHLVTDHGALDLLTLPAHLGSFEELRARAHEVSLGGAVVPIAAREDLIRMKSSTGRPQDAADVRLLEALDDEN